MPAYGNSSRRDSLMVGGLHAVLALYFWVGRGVTIVHEFGPDPWSWFRQNIPTDLLRERALESLWWLHAEPPLWNALGAVFIKVFGDASLQMLQGLNIAMGVGACILALDLVAQHTGSRRWALTAGVGMALHPSLFLYEAYALPTVLVAFLVLLAAWLLSRGTDRRASWWPLVGFAAVVSALVLTTSLYHLGILLAVLPFVVLLRGRPPLRPALVLALLLLIPAGWYGKNAVQHGFFGGSSWHGMGLWKTALFLQDNDVLNQAYLEGELDPVIRVVPFSPPSTYVDLGYDRTSQVPLLARHDLHNVNVPDISAAYQRSAQVLILKAPGRYFANVVMGYGSFSAPSSTFRHLDPNRERMGAFGLLEQWLLLRPVFNRLEQRLEGGQYYGSLFYFLLPAVLLTYLFQVTRSVSGRAAATERIRDDAILLFLAGITLYTVLAGCAMELGENVRFKFLIEPAFLTLTFSVVYRLVGRAPTHGGAVSEEGAP